MVELSAVRTFVQIAANVRSAPELTAILWWGRTPTFTDLRSKNEFNLNISGCLISF